VVTKNNNKDSVNYFAVSPKIKINKKQTQEVKELID
jgi:hypothetical protein